MQAPRPGIRDDKTERYQQLIRAACDSGIGLSPEEAGECAALARAVAPNDAPVPSDERGDNPD
jgi:hypothetical protein